jgi:hypothetical protein
MVFAPNYSTSNRMEPPNLKQMIKLYDGYYWFYYEWDLGLGQGLMHSKKTECWYHFHTLNMLGELLIQIENQPELHSDVRVSTAVTHLLTYTRNGVPGLLGASTANYPLYQAFLAATNSNIVFNKEVCPRTLSTTSTTGVTVTSPREYKLYDEVLDFLNLKFSLNQANPT